MTSPALPDPAAFAKASAAIEAFDDGLGVIEARMIGEAMVMRLELVLKVQTVASRLTRIALEGVER